MSRWAYLAVPVGAVLLIGGWWAADALLAPPAPQLGPVVVVTPHEGRPFPPSLTPTPDPDEATAVTPAPPPPAGDDDDDDDDDDDLDDDDD